MKLSIGSLVLLASASLGARAEAQFGGGYGGYGFGFGYNQNAYSDVNYLNSRANILASAAANNSPRALTAPQFQTRDDTFYDRYDPRTREAMINEVARNPAREMGTAGASGRVMPAPDPGAGPRSPSTPTAPSEPASVHLANYFNKDHQLVWPSMSPISGDFGKKQTTADLAILAVLNEYDMKGLAQVSNVTNAREKLLDYGRPALQYVRENSTPALADTFHVFLLSLYGNLGAAATVPKPK